MISMRSVSKSIRMDSAWLLPILAILGSALSMIAIGILLTHFNSRPIFDWNGVTLNAIVAVFSAMFKAMLAYTLSECLGQAKWIWFSSKQRSLNDIDLIDSVSRGPLGSFKILTQPAARTFISMGAIIVIFSAVIDPFIQLTIGQKGVVRFENNSNIQIVHAKRYSKELQKDGPRGAEPPVADLEMQSAVSEGLIHSDSWISQQTQYSCPSGNCTWDTFTSLAICSSCHDITNRVQKTEGGYRLPNNLFSGTNDGIVPMTAYGTVHGSNTVSFTSFDTLLWSMTIMNLTMNEERASSGNSTTMQCGDWYCFNSYTAVECGLWYCVNSYKSAVKNGILTEIIQPAPSEKNIDSWRPFRKSKLDAGVFMAARDNGTHDGLYALRRTDLQLGEGFNVSQGAIYSIAYLMDDTFTARSAGPKTVDVTNAAAARSRVSPSGPMEYDPPAMDILYNSQNLTATFATLAKSMTNNIRKNSDGHTVIRGKEGQYVILIRIRGWFLTLPVMLIFNTVIFLALVLHYTHISGIEFWGTNALSIVALGGKMGPVFDENDMRASMMERTAKRQLVQYPTLQARPDFDRVDTLIRSENHSENHGTVRSPRTSATQSPSAHPPVIQSPQADAEDVVSPIRTSEIPNPSADVVSIASPTRTLVIHGPSNDAVSVISSDT